MAIASEADIERIARGLIDRTLPKPQWTHAAHFAAALWLLRRHGAEAQVLMPPLIRAYNEASGVANTATSGYHETITLASLRVAANCLARLPAAPLHEVLRSLLSTPMGRSDWILTHWSPELLYCARARAEWVEPDLRPLPPAGLLFEGDWSLENGP